MELSRQKFLVTSSAAAAAVLAPGRLLAALEAQAPPPPDLSSWPAIRAQFALARDYLHFSRFYLASLPRPVRDAIEGFRCALDTHPDHLLAHGMLVPPSPGVRLPIRAIAEAVRDANQGRDDHDRALLIVDGVHGLGAVDETVAELGCDFFCAGTHKWMFAPRGTGIIWAKPESWARV